MIEVGKIVQYIEHSIAHKTVSIAESPLSKSTHVDTYTRNIKHHLFFRITSSSKATRPSSRWKLILALLIPLIHTKRLPLHSQLLLQRLKISPNTSLEQQIRRPLQLRPFVAHLTLQISDFFAFLRLLGL